MDEELLIIGVEETLDNEVHVEDIEQNIESQESVE